MTNQLLITGDKAKSVAEAIAKLEELEARHELEYNMLMDNFKQVIKVSFDLPKDLDTYEINLISRFYESFDFMILEKDIAGNIIDYFLGYGSYGQQYKSIILIILTIFSTKILFNSNYL